MNRQQITVIPDIAQHYHLHTALHKKSETGIASDREEALSVGPTPIKDKTFNKSLCAAIKLSPCNASQYPSLVRAISVSVNFMVL